MSFQRQARRLRRQMALRRVIFRLARLSWLVILPAVLVWTGQRLGLLQASPRAGLVLSLALLAGGLTWALWPLPRLAAFVRRADRALGLREALTTALEREERSARPNLMEARLIEEASQETGRLRRGLSRRSSGWSRELLAWLGVALLLVAGYLAGLTPPEADAAPADDLATSLAPPPVFDPLAAFPSLPGPGLQEGGDLFADPTARSEALRSLREALQDDALLREVSQALGREDLEGAARRLRQLADELESLTPEARQRLSRSLEQAARDVEAHAPDLARQLEETARALEQDREGAEALERLAAALDAASPDAGAENQGQGGRPGSTASGRADPLQRESQGGLGGNLEDPAAPVPGGGLGGATAQRKAEAGRLGVEGVPVSLSRGVVPPGLEPISRGRAERVPEGQPLELESGRISGAAAGSTEPVRAAPPVQRLPFHLRGVLHTAFAP